MTGFQERMPAALLQFKSNDKNNKRSYLKLNNLLENGVVPLFKEDSTFLSDVDILLGSTEKLGTDVNNFAIVRSKDEYTVGIVKLSVYKD